METTIQRVVLALVSVALITRTASAAQIQVGGSQGWDESVDYKTWASKQTFSTGDQLVFKYSSLHSVVELPDSKAYDSCDISAPLNSMTSGKDVVKLDKGGTRYFACGTAGHCSQGMKLKVAVGSTNASSSSSSPPSSSSANGSSTSTSSPSSPAATASSGSAASSSVLMVAISSSVIWMLYNVL